MGLLSGSMMSRYSMKSRRSDGTGGSGICCSSSRQLIRVITFMRPPGCSITANFSASSNSSLYEWHSMGLPNGPTRRIIFAMHHASVCPSIILSPAPNSAIADNFVVNFSSQLVLRYTRINTNRNCQRPYI